MIGTARIRRRDAGLTLIELMVALGIGVTILASVYSLYQASANAYRVQSEVANTEGQLRLALQHLRRDAHRAGFRATAHSTSELGRAKLCWVPPGDVYRAFSIERNTGFVAESGTNANIAPSAVTFFGDYFMPDGNVLEVYRPAGDNRTLRIVPSSMPQNWTEQEFERIFRPTIRYLHVVNQADNQEWIARVQSVQFETLTIQLTSAPGEGSVCQRQGVGPVFVNPVGWIRYRLAADTTSAELFGGDSAARLMGKTDLIREEVDANGTPVNGTQLVIAEYVVDLQVYDAIMNIGLIGAAEAYDVLNTVDEMVGIGNASGLLAPLGNTAVPQDLRFATFKVSVRTAEEDRDLTFLPRGSAYGPIRYFDIDPTTDGSARVVSQAVRAEFRNIAIRRF